MSHITETLNQANYEYVMLIDKKQHILYNRNTDTFELWATNNNYAGYTLKWRNTQLEYCASINYGDKIQTRYGTFICNNPKTMQ